MLGLKSINHEMQYQMFKLCVGGECAGRRPECQNYDSMCSVGLRLTIGTIVTLKSVQIEAHYDATLPVYIAT